MSLDPFSEDLYFPYLFIFPAYSLGFPFQVNYQDFFKLAPFSPTSPPALFLCVYLSHSQCKNGESQTFRFPPHNGSFVFSEPKTEASSNVLLFYVTTEVAVTCWLLMNKYIYLASKPAHTVE